MRGFVRVAVDRHAVGRAQPLCGAEVIDVRMREDESRHIGEAPADVGERGLDEPAVPRIAGVDHRDLVAIADQHQVGVRGRDDEHAGAHLYRPWLHPALPCDRGTILARRSADNLLWTGSQHQAHPTSTADTRRSHPTRVGPAQGPTLSYGRGGKPGAARRVGDGVSGGYRQRAR